MTTIADRYAAAKAQLDAAQAAVDALKAEIKALGMETLEGDYCTVTLGLSERKTLDQKEVAKLLTPEQLVSCQRTTLVETIRIKAKVPQQVAA